MFRCVEFGGPESYLRSDLSLVCYTREYYSWVIYSCILISVYPIGVPVVCGTVLYLNRGRLDPHLIVATVSASSDEKDAADSSVGDVTVKKSAQTYILAEAVASVRMDCDAAIEQRENDESVQWMASLYEAYEPRCYYFEIIELARRLLLSAALVLFFDGTSSQIVCGCLIAYAFMEVFQQFGPYLSDYDDKCSDVSQNVTFLTLFATLLLFADVSDEDGWSGPVLAGVMIVVQLVAMLSGVALGALENFQTQRGWEALAENLEGGMDDDGGGCDDADDAETTQQNNEEDVDEAAEQEQNQAADQRRQSWQASGMLRRQEGFGGVGEASFPKVKRP